MTKKRESRKDMKTRMLRDNKKRIVSKNANYSV